jgi:hypothetical protein
MRKRLGALFLMLSLAAGLASAEQPLYVLTAPTPTEKIGCWADRYNKYDTIVGYSVLGDFFLRASENNEYAVLHPFAKTIKSYGVFPNPFAFEKAVLRNAGFVQQVLRADHVAEVRNLVGPIQKNEVFIPKPYPFVGGSDKPETYGKGDVWVFMDIVAQMQGLCD